MEHDLEAQSLGLFICHWIQFCKFHKVRKYEKRDIIHHFFVTKKNSLEAILLICYISSNLE
jgi:hypothetical protein